MYDPENLGTAWSGDIGRMQVRIGPPIASKAAMAYSAASTASGDYPEAKAQAAGT